MNRRTVHRRRVLPFHLLPGSFVPLLYHFALRAKWSGRAVIEGLAIGDLRRGGVAWALPRASHTEQFPQVGFDTSVRRAECRRRDHQRPEDRPVTGLINSCNHRHDNPHIPQDSADYMEAGKTVSIRPHGRRFTPVLTALWLRLAGVAQPRPNGRRSAVKPTYCTARWRRKPSPNPL